MLLKLHFAGLSAPGAGKFTDRNAMCDHAIDCLWYLLAMLIMMVVPTLLLFWMWYGLLR
jgi:hypothetical protein